MTIPSPSDFVGPPLRFTGAIASVNSWHQVGRGKIYESSHYRNSKENMAAEFFLQWIGEDTITYYVDLYVTVSMWKMRDTDGCIKAIQDALEDAKIIENDNLIRNVTIDRTYHPKGNPDELYLVFTTVKESI